MRALYAVASSAAVALAIWHVAGWLATATPARAAAAAGGLLLGALAADFVAGAVHWACDTWGDTDTPWLGDNLIRWFRDHHSDPISIARHDALEIDGPAALAAAPALALLALPSAQAWLDPRPFFYAFVWSLCCVGAVANHLHAWAHSPHPPVPVRTLQRLGVLLSRRSHALHHRLPHDDHYCIATGWLNRPLDAVGFWRALEALVRSTTGATPRAGESAARVLPSHPAHPPHPEIP